MNFTTAISTCFAKYANFQGRASRSEFWYFALLSSLCFFVAYLIGGMLTDELGLIIEVILLFIFFIPSLSVLVRRLHDTNNSGWLALLNLIPFIGSIIMLVFACLAGTDGENKFGAKP